MLKNKKLASLDSFKNNISNKISNSSKIHNQLSTEVSLMDDQEGRKLNTADNNFNEYNENSFKYLLETSFNSNLSFSILSQDNKNFSFLNQENETQNHKPEENYTEEVDEFEFTVFDNKINEKLKSYEFSVKENNFFKKFPDFYDNERKNIIEKYTNLKFNLQDLQKFSVSIEKEVFEKFYEKLNQEVEYFDLNFNKITICDDLNEFLEYYNDKFFKYEELYDKLKTKIQSEFMNSQTFTRISEFILLDLDFYKDKLIELKSSFFAFTVPLKYKNSRQYKEQYFKPNSVKRTYFDGYYLTLYSNGDKKQCFPNGDVIYYYCKTNIIEYNFTETKKYRLIIFKNENQIEMHFLNGKKLIK